MIVKDARRFLHDIEETNISDCYYFICYKIGQLANCLQYGGIISKRNEFESASHLKNQSSELELVLHKYKIELLDCQENRLNRNHTLCN